MGITIESFTKRVDVPIVGFHLLRKDIIHCLGFKELDEHFAKGWQTHYQIVDWSDYNKETDRLCKKYKPFKNVIKFAFMSDFKGSINRKTCKLIIDFVEIKREHFPRDEIFTRNYGYVGHDRECYMDDILELLKECCEIPLSRVKWS